MAQEFDNELTISIWLHGDVNHPCGHAAFRVRSEGELHYCNYDDGDGVDYCGEVTNRIYRMGMRGLSVGEMRYRMSLRNEQAQRRQERDQRVEEQTSQTGLDRQKEFGHTAPIKVKLPFQGTAGSTFGLPWSSRDFVAHVLKTRVDNLYRTSPAAVAIALEQFGADCYVAPPFSSLFRYEAWMLDVWAKTVRARIDDLNNKADELTMSLQLNYGKGFQNKINFGEPEHKKYSYDYLMTLQEWKELSREGSLIRSPRIREMDRLIGLYHEQENNRRQRYACVIGLLDLVLEYHRESKGSRENAVMLLGREVLSVAKKGVPNYRNDSWWDSNLEEVRDFNRVKHYT
jgi:hypothetical protein